MTSVRCASRAPDAVRIIADVAGPVCESGDFLALDRDMVAPQPGDLLAVMTAGAYGAVQAGTYNTRALVPEVLVRESEWALVRPRAGGLGPDRARPPAALALKPCVNALNHLLLTLF